MTVLYLFSVRHVIYKKKIHRFENLNKIMGFFFINNIFFFKLNDLMTLMDMIYYVICFTVQPFGRTRHKFELNTHRYICFFYRYDNKSLGPENVRF